MGRTPFDYKKHNEQKQKKQYYSVFLRDAPQESRVVTGWNNAQVFMLGRRNILHKGFVTEKEAKQYLYEVNELARKEPQSENPKSPKDNALRDYPALVGRMRKEKMCLYYSDASYDRKTGACSGGIWSPTLFYQQQHIYDAEKGNHQRGELMAILNALEHFNSNIEVNTDHVGCCIFTDSDYSEKTINVWVHDHVRRKNASGQWLTNKNQPVKHQDVIEKIVLTRTRIHESGKRSEIHYIPRELNKFADGISRGNEVKRGDEEGKFFLATSC